MKTLTTCLLCASFTANAGMFLDLDLATPINNYNSSDCVPSGVSLQSSPAGIIGATINCEGGHYVGDSGTLGIVRIGYQTKPHSFGPVDVSAHAYYIHISDPLTSDGGLDALAAGVRFQ